VKNGCSLVAIRLYCLHSNYKYTATRQKETVKFPSIAEKSAAEAPAVPDTLTVFQGWQTY
jgi:hypothetical protein